MRAYFVFPIYFFNPYCPFFIFTSQSISQTLKNIYIRPSVIEVELEKNLIYNKIFNICLKPHNLDFYQNFITYQPRPTELANHKKLVKK